MTSSFDAAAVADIPPGRGRTVEFLGRRYALFNVEGTFHAIDDACPHRGASMGEGWCDGRTVHCPLHGWTFDIPSGACLTRPDRPVNPYPAEVREGRVWIHVPKP
jgi:nitrite reductase/ring-hydroxylating ferredoxin subunit